MISLSRVKRAMGFVLAGALVVIGAAALASLTAVVISYGTGADPATAFTDSAEPLSVRSKTVEWNEDEPGLLRSVERQTRIDVAKAWVGAISGEANDTWFSGGALQRQAEASRLDASVDIGWDSHEITTYFYSLDGQVLGLEISSNGSFDSQGGNTFAISEDYEVVMVLRDGNWRVERLTRL